MIYRSDGRGYSEPGKNSRLITVVAVIFGLAIIAGVTLLAIKGYRAREAQEMAQEPNEVSEISAEGSKESSGSVAAPEVSEEQTPEETEEISEDETSKESSESEEEESSEETEGEVTVTDVEGDWRLILVNPWNKLPDGYEVPVTALSNGLYIDERVYPDLKLFIDDCRAAGHSPYICSAYRTWDTQVYLYNNQVQQWIGYGYSEDDAKIKAATVVALPGTSEHQLGLAVDIVDSDNRQLNSTQADNATQQWMMENCWKYGFILRFPSDKEDITGISYEPWHYRYVGRDAAKEITEQGICLEEYLGKEEH